MLPLSLTISGFPVGAKSDARPTLYPILEALLPSLAQLNFPLNLDRWSDAQTPGSVYFAPRSVDEDLHSGVLQLPAGTVITVIESGVKEGEGSPRNIS